MTMTNTSELNEQLVRQLDIGECYTPNDMNRAVDFDKVLKLIEQGADVNLMSKMRGSVLFLASKEGHIPLVKALLQRNVDMHFKNHLGWNALFNAAWGGHFEVMEMLLDAGIDANVRNFNNKTALSMAVFNGDEKIVRRLLKESHLEVSCEVEGKALVASAGYDSVNSLKVLLEKVDIDFQDDLGVTALMRACEQGKRDALELLLKHGANVSIQDFRGNTALMLSLVTKNCDAMVLPLISASDSSSLNAVNNESMSPLMTACLVGNYTGLKSILESGIEIDVTLKDKYGDTALDMLLADKHEGAINLLQNYIDSHESESSLDRRDAVSQIFQGR